VQLPGADIATTLTVVASSYHTNASFTHISLTNTRFSYDKPVSPSVCMSHAGIVSKRQHVWKTDLSSFLI